MAGYEFDKKIGRRLAKLRPAEKSQQDVAKDLGIKRESINHWENGVKHIKAEDIAKLAEYYNTSSDFILGLSNVATPDIDTQAAARRYGLSEEALNTIEFLSDNEKWSLEMLLKSEHFSELLHSIARCYAARQSVHFEEAVIRANQSKRHTITTMTAHTPEVKEAWSSIQAELSRLQKKSLDNAKNEESNEINRIQRIAANIGEEMCKLSREEAPTNGDDHKA